MPSTNAPVKFADFQALLNRIGYGLSHHDQKNARIHWSLDGKTPSKGFEKAPLLLTTLRPDFTAAGIAEQVYDRDYVVDLLTTVLGNQTAHVGHLLMAILCKDT
jgi:hypothetical protein